MILDEQHGAPYNLCTECATVAIYMILFLLTRSADNQHDGHRKKRRLEYVESRIKQKRTINCSPHYILAYESYTVRNEKKFL